jgi:hypothetical protein
MMHARWIRGALAYWDTHQNRILNAWGPSVSKLIEEWVGVEWAAASTPAGWTCTLVNLSTVTASTAAGGHIILTTAGAENDGVTLQLSTTPYLLTAALPCYFGIKFQISSATESDFLVGLCASGATPLTDAVNGVFFRKIDGTTTCNLVLEKASAETAGAVLTVVAATDYTLEWYYDGTYVDSWVNGTKQTRLAVTNIPTAAALTPTIEFLSGEIAAPTMTVDWVRAIQFN